MPPSLQLRLGASILIWACASASAQTSEQLNFEVASVRPSPSPQPNTRVFYGPPRGGPGTSDPGRITWTAASMLSVLMAAYDLQAFQINPPAWAATTRYDIAAKVPPGATQAGVRVMWQNLLRDRFGVVLHHEPKEFQVYELTVAKGGLKLKETDLPSTAEPFDFAASSPKIGPDGSLNMNGTGSVVTVFPAPNGATARLAAKGFTMSDLAARLGGWVPHPILDKTGLTGRFDFVLEFTPDTSHIALPTPGGPPAAPPAESAAEPGSNAASAVEKQLGLKLTEAKATLDVIVVDRAGKTPTEN